MNRILKKQRERNTGTAPLRHLYAGHREKVMALLEVHCPGPHARLCVLGAGNCNDLDLLRLSHLYKDIHLVDWDAASLREGVDRQPVSSEDFVLHTGVELTGIAGYLERWKEMAPTNEEINQVIALLAEPYSIGINTSFDVVLSASLLTQLIEIPNVFLGKDHPRRVEVVLSMRAAHFRLMASLLAAPGTGILVTEVNSSDNVPELKTWPEDQFDALQSKLIKTKRHFAGTNPQALEPALRGDPVLAAKVGDMHLTPPWRWQIGPDRYFLAYGFVFRAGVESKGPGGPGPLIT